MKDTFGQKGRLARASRPSTFFVHRQRLLVAVAVGLVSTSFALRAQTTPIFSESFQPVQAEGWNAMSWNLGAAAGVVPTTQFWPGSYAYTLYAYGGGAAGWAQYNTPLLAGKSAWTYQAKAKYVQNLFNGTPQPGWYGEGGLLISSGEGTSGNWIWVGWNNNLGEFDPNTSWAQPIIYWNLGGQSGGGIQSGPGMRSFRQGDPFTLTVSRSGGTITLTIDSPVDGQRVVIQEFTGDAAAALDTLQYIGFINYFSQWEYDDVSVSDADGEIYANDFENGGQPGWNTTSVGSYWWDRGDTGGTNGLFAFRDEATGGGAAGWAVYTAPVLTNTSTNWSYSGLAKWTASHNPGVPYYGNGYLLLAAATNIGAATDFVSVGFTRGDYDGTGNSWAYPFYEYRLNGTNGSAAFTGGGAFRDFTDSPPINIKVSRSAGSSDLTFVIDTPLDGSRTNTISFTGEEAAALDGLQYVGLMNYYSTFQFSDLQVTTFGAIAPTITSTNTFAGTVGVAFSNTVTATGDEPIAFSGTNLPAGLSVATNGVISGTPTAAGVFTNAVLTASNPGGSTNQAATFTIGKGTPTISVAPAASAITAGQALSASFLSGGNASVAGTFAWTDGTEVPSATGSYGVTFTPTDTANYDTATTSVEVTVNPAGSTFASWSGGGPTNSALVGKYGIGGAINSSVASEAPVSTVDSNQLSLSAIVRTNDSKLTVVGEAGGSLTNWSTNGVLVVASTDTHGVPEGHQRRVFSVERTNSPNRQFLRLKATLAP